MKFKFRSIVIATFFTVHLSAQEPTCYHYDQGTTREKNIKPYDLVLEIRLKEKEGKV